MGNLKVGWIGYGGSSYLAEEIRPIIKDLGMSLFTISEWDNADIKWERLTWLSYLKQADIIICPIDYKTHPAKSANRVTQALSMGIPVISSPHDAYLRVLQKYPDSFLIADTPEEWKDKLKILRDSKQLRSDLSEKGLIASKDYSIGAIIQKWTDILIKDQVDIIIPTYKNLKGIELCIESIKSCTDTLYNIIVINNGSDEKLHDYLSKRNDIRYIKKPSMNFSQAINTGIKAGNSKYVLLMNDDIIVSKGWLKDMMAVCTDSVGAVGLLSNCDKGWLHNYNINIGDVELLPGLNTFDQIVPIIPKIYDYVSPYKGIIEREWVAFYCTLIPRRVIDKVGYLDEKFVNSGEDTDFCHRIKKMGYRIVQNFESFVFHFGAVSRKLLEKEDRESYQKSNTKTQVYLKEKWDKETVVIYSGPSWERWDFRSVDSTGIGGSETWQVYLARELSKLGYRVLSFCDCQDSGIKDGDIEYLHYTQYNKFIEENWIDYLISSRTTDTLKFPVRAGKIYVLSHDIWLLSPKNQTFIDRVTKFCALSEWHKVFLSDYHGIPLNKIEISSNGIDFERFNDTGIERNPYRLIYSSSADRGLDTLLYLFDFIKAEIPQLELHVFYGFDNWMKSIKAKGKDHELKKLKDIQEGLNKPGVFYHGRVGQKELAIEFMKSSLWAQPTDFEEVFCITALEAQRAGVPVITSNYAGLKTTIGDSGILIGDGKKGESYTKEYRDRFVCECVSILKDRDKWKYWSDKGFKNTDKYSWSNVAVSWKNLFRV